MSNVNITDWQKVVPVSEVRWMNSYIQLPTFDYFFNKSVPQALAYYRFEEDAGEDAIDSTGNGYTLTDTGGFKRFDGKNGKCAGIDLGLNDAKLVLTPPFNFASAFSFSLWVKTEAGKVLGGIISQGLATGLGGFSLYDFGANLILSWVTAPYVTDTLSVATVGDGNWHFVVFGYDGANFFVSVDGGAKTTKAGTYINAPISERLVINTAVATTYLLIDELAVYDVELSGAQITTLYNAGAGLFPLDIVDSEILLQYNYSAPNNFSLPNGRIAMPVDCNYELCIRYRQGDQVTRYKMWANPNSTLQNVPLYNGQKILKNFVLEIWNIAHSNRVTNNAIINLSTSVKFDLGNDLRTRPDQILAIGAQAKAEDIQQAINLLPLNFGQQSAWLDNP